MWRSCLKKGEEEPDLSKGHVCGGGRLWGAGRYLYGVSSFLIRKRAGQKPESEESDTEGREERLADEVWQHLYEGSRTEIFILQVKVTADRNFYLFGHEPVKK